ncbi:MAG: imidazole glycerol phosphate synthase subunit HisH [Deltaproteobacteria bacterium]|nr:imidazole glycerol phosphate synthase subunit HisH [Deltaproteobacteria bacterium]MBW2152324.1 imidazole glycerol phosphate synthase subunit HisH [Deltaproteobacteria bacterium]
MPGRVRKLKAGHLKLPHIGWNQIERLGQSPLLPADAENRDYFFVHSYILECPEQYIVAKCEYGEPFAAVVQRENVFGIQFHPEKSRDAGLNILRNFLSGGSCSKSAWFLSSF